MSAGDGKRRRARAPERRPHQLGLRLSDEENSLICAAASRTGAKAAAWLVEAGIRAAREQPPAVPARQGTQIADLHPDLSPGQRAMLEANLVRMSDIVTRTGAPSSTVSAWKAAFAAWPDPLVPPHGGTRSTGAVYWWPDVERFLRDNNLTRQHLEGR